MDDSIITRTQSNPRSDDLLTPQNSAILIIDVQPIQVTSVASMDRRSLVENIVAVAKTAWNQPTTPQVLEAFGPIEVYDRTTVNPWEDAEFLAAVKATGRKKLIMIALWTEVCLAFPALARLSLAGAHPITWVQLLCEYRRDWNRTETAGAFAKLLFTVEGH